MSTPLWRFDTKSDTIALTYDTLHTHYLAFARGMRSQITANMYEHDRAQVDRFCEILLMGMRLCDLKMGTAAEINECVDIRLEEINREVRPFWPDPLVMRLTKASGPDEAGDAIDRGTQGIEEALREEDIRPEELSLPLFPQSPASSRDEDEWEDDFSHSEEEDEPSPSHNLPFRSQPPPDTRDEWSKTQTKLVETLTQFDEFYGVSGIKKDQHYKRVIESLQDAINAAYRRPPSIDPVQLWLDTEKAYLALTELDGEQGEEVSDKILAAVGTDTEYGEELLVPETPPRAIKSAPKRGSRFESFTPNLPAYLNDVMLATVLTLTNVAQRKAERLAANSPEAEEPRTSPAAPSESFDSAHRQSLNSVQPTDWNDSSILPSDAKQRSSSVKVPIPSAQPEQPHTPTDPAPRYIFPPLLHDSMAIRTLDIQVQRYFRNTVHRTLTDLYNSNENPEFRKLLDAYWDHVEREVPKIKEDEKRIDPHKAWLGRSTGAPGRGFR